MKFRFEVELWLPDECGPDAEFVNKDWLDLGPLYYGDKHQEYGLTTVPGSIRKVEE